MPKPVKSTTRNATPLNEKISYDVNEILERKAEINVKDLLTVAPTVKREFFKAIKSHTAARNDKALSLNFFEDDDVDTTAIYTDFYINDVRVKSMLDTGSAKTCMSKDAADKLQLVIDSPSTSVFTLGNGTKQPSLGIVYDVPLNLGGNIIIPGSVEVLPVCPTNLIIGNNWMKRAKAKLNLEAKLISVEYKGLKAKNPFTYTRTTQNKQVTSTNMKYVVEGNMSVNTMNPSKSIPNDVNSDEDDSSEEDANLENVEDGGDDDEESSTEQSDSDNDMLLMLEDEYNEISDPEKFGQLYFDQNKNDLDTFHIFVKDNYFYIPPHSQRHYRLNIYHMLNRDKLKSNSKYHVVCDIESEQLCNNECMWTPSASYIMQKGDEVHLILVNDTDTTIVLDPGDPIATLDVIYMSEIDEFKAFKVGNFKPDDNCHDLFCYDVQDDVDIRQYEETIQDKIDISNVPKDVKKEFLKLIHNFDHIFDWNNNKIGNIDVGEHEILLKPDAIPRRVKPYRLSRLETESLQKEIDKLLSLGIIERAGYSDWASPLIMLKKKDGTYRIVADFRYLNSQSQIMNYPLTNIDEL
ncbi:hypothetical protein, partial, partial [Parasitella parasitica]